ncbi:MAG: polysaccharide deacetylase [Rhodobacteraceae bacterium]|nr:MAG: polysaccharide deacetylase [Paracoccaceae bacterium]
MTPDWTPLDRELDRWATTGLCLPIWWRDDDAIAPSPALERLDALAAKHGLPVHLAVIPQGATQVLAAYVRATPNLIPVVHGWAHASHALQGAKKAEYPDTRNAAEMADEAAQSLTRLSALFGPDLSPMFAPPWNRISPRLVADLAGLGYSALSTFTPRDAAFAAPGLAQVNTHLDPISWKSGRGLVAPDILIAHLVRQLADRREGRADAGEPYGILTHHLVHDEAIWGFTDALLSRLMAGPTRRWNSTDQTQKDTNT